MIKNDKKCACLVYEGCKGIEFKNSIMNNDIVRFEYPETQSAQLNWAFLIHLQNEDIFCVSNLPIALEGWEEFYSLEIQKISKTEYRQMTKAVKYEAQDMSISRVKSIIVMAYEDDEIYVEGGLKLKGINNDAIVIVAASSPGAVSVSSSTSSALEHSDLELMTAVDITPK